MKIKAKLRSIGTSQGIIIPKKLLGTYKKGDMIPINIITKEEIQNKQDLKYILQTK